MYRHVHSDKSRRIQVVFNIEKRHSPSIAETGELSLSFNRFIRLVSNRE